VTDDARASVTIAVIDDDPASVALVEAALREPSLTILTSTDAGQGLELVLRTRPQIVLLDLLMPGMSGMEVLDRILARLPETDVVLITGDYSTDSAVEAIRKGAADYLTKPVSPAVLRQRIGPLIEQARQYRLTLDLDEELIKAHRFEGIVGRSAPMRQVFVRIRRVAPHFRTALISGATGTGKELVAAALHRLSPVAGGRYAVCNCSAVVETLFESELFGHVRGAFTGAAQDKMGLFEYANGGVVFLDEIGDLPLEMQSKLLRVLENGEVQRVGSPAVRRVDVRVVAATNRDLREMIAGKRFREDLFYRLSMVEIKLPRLTERREDLPLLTRFFLDQFAAQYRKSIRGLTPRAETILDRYSWPGNVRELKSVLGSACMMAEGEWVDAADLPEHLRGSPEEEPAGEQWSTLEEIERRYIAQVLEAVGGNKVRAAKILGINRATVYRALGGGAADGDPAEEHPPDAGRRASAARLG
jgi:DNA-binding NtrC family response regulator